ncbi:ABC transporter ATP-binding protein [Actinoplanes sp. NPDC049548]|uniref:ABC transporter ATP-binding protein n=1 Tax=Actinoplanes sp. NPDC049548 TaxID=3155152 RepID=UPI00343BAE1B
MTVIDVHRLRKRYGETTAVADVSLAVEAGEIFGILGPNGAGKTTTVECIAGLRKPDGGRIGVLGREPGDPALRRLVGVQLQESRLPEKMTVREALELFSAFYRDPADWRGLAAELGLTAKLRARFGKLSGGQRQRLSIALALLGNPRVAILDELTTGLDPQARRDTWDLVSAVRDRGVTVVLVTHFMEEAERLCDRVALIDAGCVVAVDTPGGLVSRVAAEQRIRFRPSVPVDERMLTALPAVDAVVRHGPQLEVVGHGDLVQAVAATLAAHDVVALDLRIERVGLDEAFVRLTGRGSREV